MKDYIGCSMAGAHARDMAKRAKMDRQQAHLDQKRTGGKKSVNITIQLFTFDSVIYILTASKLSLKRTCFKLQMKT
jgi:hypothetical protein